MRYYFLGIATLRFSVNEKKEFKLIQAKNIIDAEKIMIGYYRDKPGFVSCTVEASLINLSTQSKGIL